MAQSLQFLRCPYCSRRASCIEHGVCTSNACPTPHPPRVARLQVCAAPQQRLHGRRAAAHAAPVQRGLPRAICCIGVAALVEQVGQHRHSVVERRPLQRVKPLLIRAVQRLGLCVRQLPQFLEVAIRAAFQTASEEERRIELGGGWRAAAAAGEERGRYVSSQPAPGIGCWLRECTAQQGGREGVANGAGPQERSPRV